MQVYIYVEEKYQHYPQYFALNTNLVQIVWASCAKLRIYTPEKKEAMRSKSSLSEEATQQLMKRPT